MINYLNGEASEQIPVTTGNEKDIPKGSRAPFDDESITCVCGNDVDISDGIQYCPNCGQRLDYSCLTSTEPVEFEMGGRKFIATFNSEVEE